jgi:toxin ParE1/3/4
LPGIRFLAIARATYWFDIDQAARRVCIFAVFFGGQDHIRHMLVRLLGRTEPEVC